METEFNLTTTIRSNRGNIPRDLYSQTVELYHYRRLLGEKRIDHVGRILEGHDSKCKKLVEGEFNIHYFKGDETARDILDLANLTISGNDKLGQEILEYGEGVLEVLERFDPSIQVLSLSDYSSFPMVSNMEMHTPCGRQLIRADTKYASVIRYWKPNKEDQWYDWDVMMEPLRIDLYEKTSLQLQLMSLSANKIKERKELNKKINKLSKNADLFGKLLHNPGCIDYVDFF